VDEYREGKMKKNFKNGSIEKKLKFEAYKQLEHFYKCDSVPFA